MPRAAQRQDRISIRLSPQSKRMLERAAAYSEKTLTDFMVDVALQKADAVVREHEVVTLDAAAFQRFQDLLLDPPAPNRTLTEAFAWYAKVTGRGASFAVPASSRWDVNTTAPASIAVSRLSTITCAAMPARTPGAI